MSAVTVCHAAAACALLSEHLTHAVLQRRVASCLSMWCPPLEPWLHQQTQLVTKQQLAGNGDYSQSSGADDDGCQLDLPCRCVASSFQPSLPNQPPPPPPTHTATIHTPHTHIHYRVCCCQAQVPADNAGQAIAQRIRQVGTVKFVEPDLCMKAMQGAAAALLSSAQ